MSPVQTLSHHSPRLSHAPLRVLVLYRPSLPSLRAQSIQVLSTAHALAQLGCHVTLIADPGAAPASVGSLPETGHGATQSPQDRVLSFYGLEPTANLHLRICQPKHKTLAGLWFRWQALRWFARSVLYQPDRSVILARSKSYADEIMSIPFGPPLVLEAHEVDSALAKEAGRSSAALERLEARLLRLAEGVVSNTQGTLQGLEVCHPGLMPANRAVVYNATAPTRVREHRPGAQRVVGYLGSLRSFKGLQTVLEAALLLGPGVSVELLGGDTEELRALGELPPNVHWAGEVPYKQVPDRIQRWSSALLPLDANLFGEKLCNPLKLWDYLAVGLPLVAADVGSLREVLEPADAHWYAPGDAAALAQAIARSFAPPSKARRRRLRSWKTRARELLSVLEHTVA